MNKDLKQLLDNKLAVDILEFFHQNQGSIDSVGGISAWVNGDREQVKDVLDKLVQLDVLKQDAEGITEGYCYTRDEKMMNDVESFFRTRR
ncbi:MAG: hypothetical protein GF392_05465 [Candidatus Omnitrophica bacterium]|nr:hypothetical protein [Candidatus Omnitrophota bacterium]